MSISTKKPYFSVMPSVTFPQSHPSFRHDQLMLALTPEGASNILGWMSCAFRLFSGRTSYFLFVQPTNGTMFYSIRFGIGIMATLRIS